MSRVVVISQLPPPIHGSTVMTRTFLQTLDELDHEWLLVDRRFSSSVPEVGKFSLRKMASAAWMPGRLLRAMWKFKPSVVVFFTTNRTFSFLVDWALSEVLRCFRIRRINYVHTVGFEALADRNRLFEGMVARLLGSAHTTVCLGPTLAEDVKRWVGESRITIIPNTVADRPADLAEREPETPPLLLYLSNLIPEKGADTFVELAIELASDFPGAIFVVAGATADQAFTNSLIAKVEAEGLSSRVQFRGAITDPQEKWCLLRNASVLVFPSSYVFEAQPLTILEALSVGTPTAAYRIGSLAPAIESASAGGIVNIGDSGGLKRVVMRILSDKSALTHMGHNAFALYEREYGRDAFRKRWDPLLTDAKVVT